MALLKTHLYNRPFFAAEFPMMLVIASMPASTADVFTLAGPGQVLAAGRAGMFVVAAQ
jgi:hypothetical protein